LAGRHITACPDAVGDRRNTGDRRARLCSETTEFGCLIFDFDGTLAENEEAHRTVFNKAFHSKKLGWNWDQHIYGRLLQVAGGKERIEFYNKSFLSNSKKISSKDIEEIYLQKTKFYMQSVSQDFVHLRQGNRGIFAKSKI